MSGITTDRRYVVILPAEVVALEGRHRYWTGRFDPFGAPEGTMMMLAAESYGSRAEARTAAEVAGLPANISIRPMTVAEKTTGGAA